MACHERVFELSPIGTIVVERREGVFVVVAANRAAEASGVLKQRSLDALIGRPVREALVGVDVAHLLARFADALDRRVSLSAVHIEPGGSGAEGIGYEIRIAPVSDDSLVAFFESGRVDRDVQSLRDSNRALLQSNRELSQFAYRTAHDLRSPLGQVSQLSKLLLDDAAAQLDAESRQLLNLIVDRVEHLGRLVDETVDHAAATNRASVMETIDLYTELEAIASVVGRIESGVHIEYAGTLPQLHGDRVVLVRILMNLLSNAVKYHDRATGRVVVGCELVGARAMFRVADDGPGIARELQGRIFKPFERGATAAPGHGLGLAMAKADVEAYGGVLELRSPTQAGGRGTEFCFSWPAQVESWAAE